MVTACGRMAAPLKGRSEVCIEGLLSDFCKSPTNKQCELMRFQAIQENLNQFLVASFGNLKSHAEQACIAKILVAEFKNYFSCIDIVTGKRKTFSAFASEIAIHALYMQYFDQALRCCMVIRSYIYMLRLIYNRGDTRVNSAWYACRQNYYYPLFLLP